MKRRNLLIAVAAILVMFAFAACSESVAPEDRLGTITFDNNTSRAVGTVVKYSNEVEDMYWYYSAAKQDDGYTTGDTGGKLLSVSANNSQGLSGKTLNNNFSYGLWNIELMGFKATTDVVDGAVKKDGGGIQYKATITNLLVDKGANYAKAEIQLGDNPETKIEFGAISFSAENIKASSDFTLTVEDDKGTVTVGTAAADIEKADKSVTFKNLTYTPKSGVDITGEHEMKFVLTQKLSGTDNINITAARYTLKFKVQPGTTTTISGTLVKNDETGTIEITSVQNVEPLTLSRSIPVENIQIADGVGVAKVSTPTTMQVGTMTVTLPAGTVIATKTDSVTENTSESTADNKKGDADGTIGFVKKDTAANGSVTVKSGQSKLTYELTLPVSTEEYDTSKKNTILVTVKTFVGKGLEGLEIYHGTSSTPLAAESEEKVPEDENEGYFYNADTGYLTLYVLHASEFHIVVKEAVAEVSGTKYYSLSEAIGAASKSGTVTLLSDVTVDSTIAITESITLDLKNKVVTVGENGNITLSEGKVLTVENSTASQTAFINAVEVRSFSGTERSYHTSLESALAAVKEGGTVTLGKDVTLSADARVSVNFTLDLKEKTVTASGVQVIVEAGTLTVNNRDTNQSEFIQGVRKGDSYTVVTAKAGDTYYSSLKDAVEAAEANTTVMLLRNTTLTETATVSKSITLDLNKKVVTVSDGAYILVEDGTLTVKNKADEQVEFIGGFKGDNGKYTAAEAKVGDTYYETFMDAIDYAASGDTVLLLRDVSSITYSFGIFPKIITIDLNGKTLDMGTYSGAIASRATIDYEWKLTDEQKLLYHCSYPGVVTIKNGTIKSVIKRSVGGYVFSVDDGNTMIFDNVEIDASNAEVSYLLQIVDEGTKVEIKDCKFTCGAINAAIGFVSCNDATAVLTIENSTITSTTTNTAYAGGGITVPSGCPTITITKSTIEGMNHGVYIGGGKTVITNSTIKANRTTSKYEEYNDDNGFPIREAWNYWVPCADLVVGSRFVTKEGVSKGGTYNVEGVFDMFETSVELDNVTLSNIYAYQPGEKYPVTVSGVASSVSVNEGNNGAEIIKK